MTTDRLAQAAALAPMYDRDRYGLPRRPSGDETESQKAMRKAQLRHDARMLLVNVYKLLRADLDEIEAAEMFASFAKPARPRKRGEHGERDHHVNRRLLEMFDQTPGHTPHERARMVASHCDAERRGEFGNSEAAIVKKIIRLAERREAKVAQATP